MEYRQQSFFHLLPGSAGGRALRDQRGTEYFSNLAKAAADRRTPQERQAIALKAAEERQRRRLTLPRTAILLGNGYRITERIVPYWPKRRKRPLFVRIELECIELAERQYLILEECSRFR
jgi:hypothetical protein